MVFHLLLFISLLCSFPVLAQQECLEMGAVRLVQTSTITHAYAGRVEICLPISSSNATLVWGTISSSDVWSEKNGHVACTQLGYDGVLNTIFTATISLSERAERPTVVHLQNVTCNGTESFISECPSTAIATVPLSGGADDVYIVCRPSGSTYTVLHTGRTRGGDIRLVGDVTNGYGIVEVYDTLMGWVSICPDSAWGSANVDALCAQLGYETGTAVTYSGVSPSLVGERRLYSADCSSGFSDLAMRRVGACSFLETTPSSAVCTAAADSFAGIQCTISSGATAGDVRLVGGAHEREGVVEILLNGRWGVICGDNWGTFESDFNDRVVCSQLGFDENMAAYLTSSGILNSESSLKPLWLHSVDCLSVATIPRLLSCPREMPIGYTSNCRSAGLAAVDCGNPPQGLSTIIVIVIVVLVVVSILSAVIFFGIRGRKYWRERQARAVDTAGLTLHNTASCNYVPPATVRISEPPSNPPVEPEAMELTKAGPPSYKDAAHCSSPKPEWDLPPPYPVGSAALSTHSSTVEPAPQPSAPPLMSFTFS